MAVITMPNLVAETIGSLTIGQRVFQIHDVSDTTGDAQTRVLAPPRWIVAVGSMNPMTSEQSAAWEALMLQLRGFVNRLALWDTSRPLPRVGTPSGAWTLSGTHSKGASSVSIASMTGTLSAGDWIQVGTGLGTSQLLKVITGATGSGSTVSVTVEPPLRIGLSSGLAVTYNKPVGYYRLQTNNLSYSAEAGSRLYGGHSLDLIESFN